MASPAGWLPSGHLGGHRKHLQVRGGLFNISPILHHFACHGRSKGNQQKVEIILGISCVGLNDTLSVLLGSGIKLNILYAPHKTSYMLPNKKFLLIFKHKEMDQSEWSSGRDEEAQLNLHHSE